MADPAPYPSANDADPSPQIQQNLKGDDNQAIGELKGGTAISKIVGNVIYNYYYREEVKIAIDDAAASAETDPLPCPYRGLFHFGPGDAEYFFGRESFVEELVRATQTRNFIPLLGASGSGKSSVVLAGLVPKLQHTGHWQFTHFRPGADPFHALALALVPLYVNNLDETERIRQSRNLAGYFRTGEVLLADVFAQIQQNFPTDRVLLIADQFEELYTLCPDETRRNFLDRLLAGIAAPVVGTASLKENRIPFAPVLIATMRADFLGNALSYRPFADVLQNADLKLGPMNRAELTEAIKQPAQKLGVTFEAGLVERILGDVEAEPGILPLLEFALTDLWQRRSGKQLTHAAYEAIGEVQGALGRHANQEYAKLGDTDRERVRRILIQLVRPGEGAEDTRRIATKAELGEQNWSLVKQLADARLVVTSRNGADLETVEVVHEALIRNWGELRGWMDTDRVFRAWQEGLRGDMRKWLTHQDSFLRGTALAEAEEHLRQRPEELVSESGFIERSIQERERIQQAETARQKREIKNARTVTVVSLLAFVVSSGLGLMAWKQTQQAELNLADALGASALSLVEQGKDLDAFITAIRAGKILQNQQAVRPLGLNALQEALNHRSEYNRLEGHQNSVTSVSFSPDGKTLASGSHDNTIKLWSLDGKVHTLAIKTINGDGNNRANSVSFSPDGKILASGIIDNRVILWDVKTGKERTTLNEDGGILSVSFSPNGKFLAVGTNNNTIKLWNLETKSKIHTFSGEVSSFRSVSFSHNSKILASASANSTIKLWDVKTGKEIRTLQGHQNSVNSVSFNPDDKTLASGSANSTIKLWDVETGKEILTLPGHQSSVNSVSFNPDGKILASGSADNTIKLWNLDKGTEIRTLQGHQNSVNSVSFNPDGKTLASGSDDSTIKLWSLETEKETLTLPMDGSFSFSVSFSHDGKILASGSNYSLIKLWNLDMGKEIPSLLGDRSSVFSVGFSPDSKILASGSLYGLIKLWNLDKGTEIRTLQGHQNSVTSVTFSPDGKTLASGSHDQTIKLWNLDKGTEIRTLQGHQNSVTSVSFSPNGQTLEDVWKYGEYKKSGKST
jgi:WD40 repeat protein